MRCGLVIIFLCVATLRAADPVDATRLIYGGTWEGKVGVEGGIPDYSVQNGSTIAAYGSAGTPGSPATINNAIAAAAGSGQHVLLGPGTFHLSGGITLDEDEVELRGSVDANGVPTTTLIFYGGSEKISCQKTSWDISNSTGFTRRNVSSGATRGSTQVVLASAPTGLAVGMVIWITNPDVVGDEGAFDFYGTDAYGQAARVTNISGSTVDFSPAINADYLTGTTQVGWRTQASYLTRSGIRNLNLQRSSTGGHFVVFRGADECWMVNVHSESVPSSTYHVYIYACFRVEIRHCEMEHMENLTNSTYCIYVQFGTALLIEDNWFHDAPNIMPFTGMIGSAFAYNYIDDLPYSPNDFLSQIVFNHGIHNAYNLFEGNWLATGYHDEGGSSFGLTYLRNRMRGYDDTGPKDGNTKCITVEPGHTGITLAGNILGENGHHTVVNDTFSGGVGSFVTGSIYDIHTDIVDVDKIGNYNTVDDAIPAGEAVGGGDAIVNSYLHSSRPSYAHYWPLMTDANVPNKSGKADAPDLLAAAYRAANSGVDPNWSEGGSSGAGDVNVTELRIGTIQVAP